jgi:hypothetical protein
MIERMNVYDLLAQKSGRTTLSDAQKRELRKNVIIDSVEFFYSRCKLALRLIKLFHLHTESNFFVFLVHPALRYYINHTLKLNYQSILDHYLVEIQQTLKHIGVTIDINAINDLARWSGINAEFSSWFDTDRRITILSGTLYFSHLFSRSFQPLFVSIDMDKKRSFFQKYFQRMFQRSVIGFVTNNHRRGLSPMFLIPEDSSLLDGMEMVIICHEMGHAYFNQYGINEWPFEPLPEDIRQKALSDEEVAADMFAIHTLFAYHRLYPDLRQILFGSCLFFLIFSWLEEAKILPRPIKHPKSDIRFRYLMSTIQRFDSEIYSQYEKYVIAAQTYWDSGQSNIKKEISAYRAKKEMYQPELDQVESFINHYFSCQSEHEEYPRR